MTSKTIFAVVSVAVALAIATVLWLNRPSSDAPVSSPSPAASKPASSTPTPDPREAEVAAAEGVYQKYSDATWAMAKASGSKDQLNMVRPYVSDFEWKTLQQDAKEMRRQPAEVKGDRKFQVLKARDVELSKQTPTLTLTVCLDYSDVDIRSKKGDKINASWLKTQVFMIRTEGVWKIDDRDDQLSEKSCAA